MLLTSSSEKRNAAVIEFKLPELGENIEQGDLVRLMVAPGASVSAGQSVMELETDKAVVEVPSSVSGTVQEIRVKEGDKIKVGQVIFTVDGAEAKAPPGASRTSATAPAAVQQQSTAVSSPSMSAPVLRTKPAEHPARMPRANLPPKSLTTRKPYCHSPRSRLGPDAERALPGC